MTKFGLRRQPTAKNVTSDTKRSRNGLLSPGVISSVSLDPKDAFVFHGSSSVLNDFNRNNTLTPGMRDNYRWRLDFNDSKTKAKQVGDYFPAKPHMQGFDSRKREYVSVKVASRVIPVARRTRAERIMKTAFIKVFSAATPIKWVRIAAIWSRLRFVLNPVHRWHFKLRVEVER